MISGMLGIRLHCMPSILWSFSIRTTMVRSSASSSHLLPCCPIRWDYFSGIGIDVCGSVQHGLRVEYLHYRPLGCDTLVCYGSLEAQPLGRCADGVCLHSDEHVAIRSFPCFHPQELRAALRLEGIALRADMV